MLTCKRFLLVDDLLEEIETHEGGLAALPDEFHHRRGLGCYVVFDKGGKDIIRHPEVLAFTKQCLFLDVETVLAGKIAHRPHGLCNDVDALCTSAGSWLAIHVYTSEGGP